MQILDKLVLYMAGWISCIDLNFYLVALVL